MNPPSRVKIGGQHWSVKVGEIDDEPEGYIYGRTRKLHAVIELDHRQAEVQMRDTLLHEVMHACWSQSPCNLTDEDEERLTRCLAPWLLAVLRDNPRLLAFLTTR